MNIKYILLGLVLLMIFLQTRKNENFESQFNLISKDHFEKGCMINNDNLNKVNENINESCNKEDNDLDRVTNNNKLECRTNLSRKIFLEKDTQSYCKDVKKLDINLGNIEFTGFEPDNNFGVYPFIENNIKDNDVIDDFEFGFSEDENE